jgi:isoleucyl-tRNA synthetase
LWDLTDGLCRLLAPILCHTTDEAHRALHKDAPDTCVHTREFIDRFDIQPDSAWPDALAFRDEVMLALEVAKKTGLDNPLDAWVEVNVATQAHAARDWSTLTRFDLADLADLCGVSRVTVSSANASNSPLRIINARELCDNGDQTAARCERSWKRDGTVRQRHDIGLLSDRDALAVNAG